MKVISFNCLPLKLCQFRQIKKVFLLLPFPSFKTHFIRLVTVFYIEHTQQQALENGHDIKKTVEKTHKLHIQR